MKNQITVETIIQAPVENVWKLWTTPDDIKQWNAPSNEWHTSHAETDLRSGGRFLYRMGAKDDSVGFDHDGVYDTVVVNELIEYTVSDGRKSKIKFTPKGKATILTETFEPETKNPAEMQRDFVQSVLNNFKKYAENKNV
jgi:uncharacterized protein YndB with AHSA1/START domain